MHKTQLTFNKSNNQPEEETSITIVVSKEKRAQYDLKNKWNIEEIRPEYVQKLRD